MSFLPFQAWDDFDVYTIGTNVAGVTLRGGGAPTYKPQYSTAAILPYKRRYLEFLTDATTDYHAVSRDLVDADANRATFDIVFGFAMSLNTVEELHVYARGQGAGTMTDFIRAAIVLGSGAIRIDKMVGSAYTAGSGASAGTVTLTAGHAYLGRFRGNGGAISLKIWDASLGAFADRQFTGEPTAFNLTPTGFTPTAAGWIALGGKHTLFTGRVAAFNFAAIATNGDVAVCPRTNAERTAWLAKRDVMRVVAAKMKATGYDSSGSPYTATRKAYIANHGYTSAAQDTPALQHFDNAITAVPAISREMPGTLSGQVEVKIGNMRVANPAKAVKGTAYLLLDGTSGCYASAAYKAAMDVLGDIDMRVCANASSWSDPVGVMGLLYRRIGGTGGYSMLLFHGAIYVQWIDAVGTFRQAGVSLGALTGKKHIRGVLDVDNGAGGHTVTVYVSDDGVAWTSMGTASAGAFTTSIKACNDALYLGNHNNTNFFNGPIYSAKIYNGIAGTLAVDFNLNKVIKGATTVSTPTGETWTLQGTAKIRETDETAPGIRDDWLRVHWLRDGFELLMGDPSWPLHDFLHVLRGRLGNPTAPDLNTIEFPIADMSEFFGGRVSTARFTSGDFNNKYKPKLFGNIRCLELQFDTVSLLATLNDGAIGSDLNDSTYRLFDCTSSAFVHIGGTKNITISSVDTATDTITASGTHNLSAGYRIQVVDGVAPAGMSTLTNYWVLAAGLTTTAFKVTATQGSTTPVDLTTAGSGARHINSFGYTFDVSAGTVTLINPPAGRVFCFQPNGASGTLASNVISAIAVTAGSLSLNNKDAAAFTAALAVDTTDGAYTGIATHVGDLKTVKELLDAVCAGARAWYGFTPDGLMQTGSLALPAATAVLSLDRSDIADIGLPDVTRPIDFVKSDISYLPWFNLGPPPLVPGISYTTGYDFGQTSAELAAGKLLWTPYSYGAAGVPLDDHPDYGDSLTAEVIETLSWTGSDMTTRLVNFRKHRLGSFPVATAKLTPLEANIGDTVSIDFPRLGFKQWSASDPASPDNTATIDNKLCVVVGHYLKPDKEGKTYSHVDLKVMRRIPGYYPTSNLN